MSVGEMISFSYEGKQYVVDAEAAKTADPIRLPDGRILVLDGWLESMPPKPSIEAVLKPPRVAVALNR